MILKRLHEWSFDESSHESAFQSYGRTGVRILLILIQVFLKVDISLRASALTYSTILSLVPMLAMSTAILKGLGSDNELKIAAYRLIDQIDPSGARTDAHQADPAAPEQQSPPPEPTVHEDAGQATLTKHLRSGIDTIFDYVDRTNFAALGAFGIAGLLFVVLLMLHNIEMTMNAIWHSRKSRPFGQKIMDYLALLVLLPISLNVAFAGDAILQSEKMMGYITTAIPSQWLVKMLFKGLPFLFIVGCLTFMYQFFPYAKVKTFAAFTGAIFSSLCWFAVQQLYISLQIGVSRYNAIYGSFATVPLFLIWLHLGWMFLLLGAALAYAVQNRYRHYPFAGDTFTPQRRLQLAFDILKTAYTDFSDHRTTTLDRLRKALVDEPVAELILTSETLIKGNLLHKVEGKHELTMTPALPADSLKAEDILKLILGDENLQSEGARFADQVIKAAGSGAPQPLFSSKEEDSHATGK